MNKASGLVMKVRGESCTFFKAIVDNGVCWTVVSALTETTLQESVDAACRVLDMASLGVGAACQKGGW